MDAWLSELNEWALFFGMMAGLMASAELGFRLAERARRGAGGVAEHASAIQGAVLGLLALLLGFTFSLAMARFETRRQIMRDEANAIGTAYLRAQLLPEPMHTRIAEVLPRYVDTRLMLNEAAPWPERVRDVDKRATALLDTMWAQLVAASKTDTDAELITLFAAALNETIDMHGTRLAAIRARVPGQVFALLLLVSVASLGLIGYSSGPHHRQCLLLNGLVALLIAAVTMLIVDLHRPTRGYITVDTAAMTQLRESMR